MLEYKTASIVYDVQHPGLCKANDVLKHTCCRNMFNKQLLGKMKKGAWLVNTARGGICEPDAIVEALESGQLGGESADSTLAATGQATGILHRH